LMLVNWGLEAWKWQWLMRRVQRLDFLRAFVATITGTSIGLITPNRVGEFAGRVLFLDPENRVQGSFATLLGSIAQFVVTLLVGGIALTFSGYLHDSSSEPSHAWGVVVWSALLIGFAAVFLFFSPGAFARLLLAIPWLRRFERHAHVLDTFSGRELVRVFVISLLRYAVFTVQFALVLQAVAQVPLQEGLVSVPVVFLLTTLVPTMALTELGVRGSVAVTFIEGDNVGIVVSAALVWAINLVVPAISGAVLLLFARIRTNEAPGA
jgi:MFS family permease